VTASGQQLPTSGLQRAVRVVVLGGSSMLLACAAHVAGGGLLPGIGLIAVLTVLVGMVAIVATARQCRVPGLLAVLGAEQLVLHYLLAAGGQSASAGGGVGCVPGTVAAAHHVGMADAMVCRSDLVATGATDTLLHATWFSMVGGHVLATVVTAWMLARGEALLWQLADQIVRASLPPAALWPAAALRVLAVAPLAPLYLPPAWDTASPRGPPAPVFAAA
jgi:hypothetical protein